MRIDVGDHVTVEITGRIAKKENGRVVRGEWISFSKGDIGRVVNRRKVDSKWLYKVSLPDGVVEMFAADLTSLRDEETRLPRSALINTDMRRMVSEADQDLTDNAEY